MSKIIIPIHLAKRTLSQLVKRAANGEIIFISCYGQEEAVLVRAKPKKHLGLLKDKLMISDDFNAPLPPEIIATLTGDIK